MSIGEFGAFVASHLKSRGIDVVLSGGSCVTIYSQNKYMSYDLDFIERKGVGRRRIKAALKEAGFTEKDRYFIHPDSQYFVEFPPGPLAVGDEPVKEVLELSFETGCLQLLSATECVKDRLAAYYHWKDLQCLEQAVMVASAHPVDLLELERWSQREGMSEEFEKIKTLLSQAEKQRHAEDNKA
jgi:hypothetical protein